MRRLATLLLAAAGTGAAMALALPLVLPWWSLREVDPAGRLEPIAFVALLPLLWAAGRARGARGAAGLGFLAGFAYFLAAIHWVAHAMTAFGGLSAWVAGLGLSLLVGFMAFHWALAIGAATLVRRALGWPLRYHLPAIWTATELLRERLFTGFPWADLGYTQVRTPWIAQLAALLGVHGLAFLVVQVNAVLADALDDRRAGRPAPRGALAVTAALVALVAAGGAARLARLRAEIAAAPEVTVGLVQANVDQEVKNAARAHAGFILDRLVPLTVAADRAGADLIAWPEAAYPLALPPDLRRLDPIRGGIPRLARAHLLLGAVTMESTGAGGDGGRWRVENSAFLLSPDLAVLGRQSKHHLVPFGEYVPLASWLPFLRQVVPAMAPLTPGRALEPLGFAGPGGGPVRVGAMICFDAIFPGIARAFTRAGADLLVNPTNDAWYGYSSGPYQFLAIVQLRAIETGRAIARPAYAGVSALILPTGELEPGRLEVGPVDPALAPEPEEPARLLVGRLPILRGRTPFVTIGDSFAWGCAALAAVVLALAAGRRRRGAAPPHGP